MKKNVPGFGENILSDGAVIEHGLGAVYAASSIHGWHTISRRSLNIAGGFLFYRAIVLF